MSSINPDVLVSGLRSLINLSKSEMGPDRDTAILAMRGIGVPEYWTIAIIDGWRRFAEIYQRAFASELSKSSPVRFLRANMLPELRFEDGVQFCRLCGFVCKPPARSWHKGCWEAFSPNTSKGWARITKAALKRCGGSCEGCRADFKMLKATTLTPWRRVYDIDHKVPLFKGGAHSLENVQVLCEQCHKDKTRDDKRVGEPEWIVNRAIQEDKAGAEE